MKILNIGSLNIDLVYRVEHIVKPGETLSVHSRDIFCGGKGLNQSIALARAGAQVSHAGMIGPDGDPLRELLAESGVDTLLLREIEEVSGHAVIQVGDDGQNSILVCGGANRQIDRPFIDAVLEGFSTGDILLLQNETSNVGYAIEAAKKKGMRVALNPSPITAEIAGFPLELVDIFIVNEVEGAALTGAPELSHEQVLDKLCRLYPAAVVVLTLGVAGAYCAQNGQTFFVPAYEANVVDSTGAGDTFCGYFLSRLAAGDAMQAALETASLAAALAISRKGAAASIPTLDEVENSRPDAKQMEAPSPAPAKNSLLSPKSILVRCLFIVIGVAGAGLGCAMFLLANLGSDPVTAFVQGLGLKLNVSTGMATNIFNVVALVILVLINRKVIHIGTAIYTLLLGVFIDLFFVWIPLVVGTAPPMPVRIFMILFGVVSIAMGLGLYQSAELGIGPSDGVNQTIALKTGLDYRWERMIFDAVMVLTGWMLGGKVWFGTIVGVLAVGPIMAPTLNWGKRAIAKILSA